MPPMSPRDFADLTVRQLYRSMRMTELVALRQAFELDARETDSAICRAFCETRLQLLGEVIREKRREKAKRAAAERAEKAAAAGEAAEAAEASADGEGPLQRKDE